MAIINSNMAANRVFYVLSKHLRRTPCRQILHTIPRKSTYFYSTEKEEISSNPFYNKYADKIKLSQEGKSQRNAYESEKPLTNLYDDILSKEVHDYKTKARNTSVKKKTMGSNSSSGSKSLYGKKGLDAVMHLDKVEKESPESISELWREYHRDKDAVSAVIPSSMYDVMQERAQKYPVFIYPVPRDEGYELMVGEFSDHQCYLTSVLNYQTLGENAPWLVAFTHFTELKESKGIVLMVGEVDTTHFATHEAMFVANLIQLFYGTDDERKVSLLKTFNTTPDKFDHMWVVKELQASTVQRPDV